MSLTLKLRDFLQGAFLGKKVLYLLPTDTFYTETEEHYNIYIYLPLVMCGTLKQEVDTEEEEAALFDNTKWCKDTANYDTCRTHTLIQIIHTEMSRFYIMYSR